MKLPVSLVIITLNEERNIERCIRSVPFASEIVVVDSGSTDKTLEIAKGLGATVHHYPWQGFGIQKAKATELSHNDWVLNLDADEALSPELAQEIMEKWQSLDPRVGYEMPRKSYHLGRWIMHGGWYPDAQLRLFNRQHSGWQKVPIHEKVEAAEKQRFKKPLLHWVFKNISHQVITNDRYSSLQAEDHIRKGKKFSLLKLVIKPWVKFIECYFLKLGFLDGFAGFVIAVGAAYSVFLRWVKIWELQKK